MVYCWENPNVYIIAYVLYTENTTLKMVSV